MGTWERATARPHYLNDLITLRKLYENKAGLLDEIRKKVETDQFEFSKHAVDQSITNERETHLVEQRVTYTLEHKGQFYVVENVPARVDEETGEQFFSPSTVERLQETVLGKQKPERVIETPVYEYAGVDRTSEK